MKHVAQYGILLLALATFCRPAQAQISVGENTEMNLSGDVVFGYNGVIADQSENQTLFGFNADLTGYYYDPKFFNFRVSPYYNESRMNSSYNNVFSGSGITATGNLFSGSHTPVSFSYSRDWNAEGNFSVAGGPGYTTNGNSSGFNIGGGLFFPKWPTLQVTYSKSNNGYTVIGSSIDGTSDLTAFSVASTYSKWGFDLAGSWSLSKIHQDVPTVVFPGLSIPQNTDNNTFQFSAGRQLWHSAHWNSTYSRTHYTSDYLASNSEQTFDTINNNINWQPTKKLMINGNANYSSNAGAFLLGLIPGGPGVPGQILPEFRASDYFIYGAHATYLLNDHWSFDGEVNHTSENYLGLNLSSTNANGGVSFNHQIWGGQFVTHGGFTYFISPTNNQTQMGYSTGFGYSHQVGNWRTATGFNYSTNQLTALLGFTQNNWNANFSASHYFFRDWLFVGSAMVGKNNVNGLTAANGMNESFSAALSHGKVSVSGSYSKSSGDSIPTPGGLVPVPIPIPGLLVTYAGSSYSFGAGYHPLHRLTITGTYSHSAYNTSQLLQFSNNTFTRLDSRMEYSFRQMTITGAYTYLNQGLGLTASQPTAVNAVYFSISRHFDWF